MFGSPASIHPVTVKVLQDSRLSIQSCRPQVVVGIERTDPNTQQKLYCNPAEERLRLSVDFL